ncbi:hypothetical protein ABZU32_37095 [Sphaerisporangium sp. NPDC005288]|uniref:hypothetical protein n=1 Tax=Sphaerisporangium sp. NPDC005288 TaxID=3155114 RepID=UPI0033A1EAEB
MNGWAPKLRRSLAAAVLGACATTVLLSPAPSAADTTAYRFQYLCRNGALLPGVQPQKIEVQVSIPTSVRVGERIPLEWKVLTESPLFSSAKFPSGGRLSITGRVNVTGLLQGDLDSTGSKDEGELAPGARLELPAGLSGSVATSKEGKLSITPGDLLFDFTPPAENVLVNDATNLKQPSDRVQGPTEYFGGGWVYSGKDVRAGWGDLNEDVHATTVVGDTAVVDFVGTGIEFWSERSEDTGNIEIYVDAAPGGATPPIEVHPYEAGVPRTQPLTQELLWSKRDLTYGDHRVTFRKSADEGDQQRYLVMDRLNLITGALPTPPKYFRTTCKYQGTALPTVVQVLPAASSGSNGGNNGNNNDENQQVSDGDDSARGVIVLSGGGSGHGAPTETASPTPKASKTSKARSTPQVRVTPRGGAHTGEAPEQDPRPGAFIAYGSVLLLGSVAGGLVLRRRRGRAA